jgi:nucleoid-associated protein YgaU
MSALEKFGILVILVLVVVIGVVAVWGGGGGSSDLFPEDSAAVAAASGDEAAPPLPEYPPAPGPSAATPAADERAPVAPPALGSAPTPPAVAAVPAPAAPVASVRTYTVQPGDTLSKIAGVVYGDRNAYHRLLAANSQLDPKRLKIGQVIQVPDMTAVADASPAPAATPPAASGPRPAVQGFRPNPADGPTGGAVAATSEYEVKVGDTLMGIAASVLRDRNKWKRIQDLNPDLDPARLRPGQRIKVPVAE